MTTNTQKSSIFHQAVLNLGRRLWLESPYSEYVSEGANGCAVSVSELLVKARFSCPYSGRVGELVRNLLLCGLRLDSIEAVQSGDFVFGGIPGTKWWEGGGNAHIAIAGPDELVFHNGLNQYGNWLWKEDDIWLVFSDLRYGRNRWILTWP